MKRIWNIVWIMICRREILIFRARTDIPLLAYKWYFIFIRQKRLIRERRARALSFSNKSFLSAKSLSFYCDFFFFRVFLLSFFWTRQIVCSYQTVLYLIQIRIFPDLLFFEDVNYITLEISLRVSSFIFRKTCEKTYEMFNVWFFFQFLGGRYEWLVIFIEIWTLVLREKYSDFILFCSWSNSKLKVPHKICIHKYIF